MMKKLLFLFILFSSISYSADNFEAGVDYELMHKNPSDYQLKKSNKIIVIEAFWYGCPHCYIIEDYFDKWKTKEDKDISFEKMPVVFNKPWLLHAKVFYTIFQLKNSNELHKNFFYAYHEQQRKFSSVDSILKFFDSQEVDIKKVKEILNSDYVSDQVKKANYKLESYEIDSVPAIIINDKYKISGRMAKTYKRMLEITDHVIGIERANRIKK